MVVIGTGLSEIRTFMFMARCDTGPTQHFEPSPYMSPLPLLGIALSLTLALNAYSGRKPRSSGRTENPKGSKNSSYNFSE
jgi:hypothetical protein